MSPLQPVTRPAPVTKPQVMQLVPLVPVERAEPATPRRTNSVFDYPVRRDYHQVVDLAGQIRGLLPESPAKEPYSVASIHAQLPQPGWAPIEATSWALQYLGHAVLRAGRSRYDQDAVVVSTVGQVADLDMRVFWKVKFVCPEAVTVRAVQRACRWKHAEAWTFRGCLERLEAAGHLVRHPGSRREPTTVWQVASR